MIDRLRGPEGWLPAQVLARFGGAAEAHAQLGRLLVASAVLGGPPRVLLMSERLIALASTALPRLKQKLDDPAFAALRPQVERLVRFIELGKKELVIVRSRAANECGIEHTSTEGLRLEDIRNLAEHTNLVSEGVAVAACRNRSGAEYAMYVAARRPDLTHVREWSERVLGSADPPGVIYYLPPEYGRVVLVHEDGRLAYDPLAWIRT